MRLEDLKGMGKNRIAKLQAAGICQPLDLLLRFPYKYVDLRQTYDISRLRDGDTFTVHGIITNQPKVQYIRKGLNLLKAVLDTQYGSIEVSWFNQKFLASSLARGKELYVTGKVKKFRNKVSLSSPTIFYPEGKTVMPLYRPIKGVPQRLLDESVDALLAQTSIAGYIPDMIRQSHGLLPLNTAFRQVHRPTDVQMAYDAMKTLSLERFGYSLAIFGLIKALQHGNRKYTYTAQMQKLHDAIATLPFELTDGQQKALREIVQSLHGQRNMNRLLQGDVGCGKTVVAFLVMYYAYLNGYQSVLMAPTEVLALQHYRSAIRYLEPLGVKCVFLSGSLSKKERDEVLFHIRTHAADVVIGTHALLTDDVCFSELALIVTDEQQRFGVNQRGKLESKARGADTLVMTATPIPRTLALCMYGELEQSSITVLPEGRPEIVTSIVPENKMDGMFQYAVERTKYGEQTYIVCPRIDCDEEDGIVSATDMHRELSGRFPELEIGLLHGRLKETEKATVMNRFASGEIRILVATTVIEVGIDVPAATNIIIFHAERYGLSQLHQLRGRVGRGRMKSYCFLPIVGEADERIRFFCGCRDGFRLSEYDFAHRGAGDFIGTRQHGDGEDLPIAMDVDMIYEAKSIAEEMLCDENTRMRLQRSISDGTEQYVRSITLN